MAYRTVTQNGYTFTVDTETGTTIARGELQSEKASRIQSLQSKAGGDARLATDQGGHLVAAQANGPAIKENLFAQDGHLNQKEFRTIENAEQNAMKNGTRIDSERVAFMSGPYQETGMRPDSYMINDHLTHPDNKVDDVHFFFTNISPAERAEFDAIENNMDGIFDAPNPGDTLRESMSSAEYSELMEVTDNQMPSLTDEFDGSSYTVSFDSEDSTVDADSVDAGADVSSDDED